MFVFLAQVAENGVRGECAPNPMRLARRAAARGSRRRDGGRYESAHVGVHTRGGPSGVVNDVAVRRLPTRP